MIYKRDKKQTKLGGWDYIIINLGVIYWMHDKNDSHGWFRLFGNWWGLKYKPKDAPLIFSEMNGTQKQFIVFGYRIGILKPAKF